MTRELKNEGGKMPIGVQRLRERIRPVKKSPYGTGGAEAVLRRLHATIIRAFSEECAGRMFPISFFGAVSDVNALIAWSERQELRGRLEARHD